MDIQYVRLTIFDESYFIHRPRGAFIVKTYLKSNQVFTLCDSVMFSIMEKTV